MQHAAAIVGDQSTERRFGIDAFAFAIPAEPVRADGDVAHFLAQDHFENIGGGIVAMLAEFHDHPGRHVQAARFEYARHQRHAFQAIVRGLFGHIP